MALNSAPRIEEEDIFPVKNVILNGNSEFRMKSSLPLLKKYRECLKDLMTLPPGNECIEMRPIIVLVSTAVCLALLEFLGLPWCFFRLFPKINAIYPAKVANLLGLIYWSCFCGFCYVVIPALITRFVFHESIIQYGLRIKGITKHLWIYVLLYLLVLPFVVIASFGKSFLNTYPFYSPPPGGWSLLLIYEIFYLLQFLYLEFFFRGYLIFNLEKTFKYYAIFVMVVPYCMIHFHKPLPEALAAIVAGVILGTLALKTRSIWYGVLIHMSVAISMDMLALFQKGFFR